MADKVLDINNVTLDDLNGNYIAFKQVGSFHNVTAENELKAYQHVFKIEDSAVYDAKLQEDGTLKFDAQPVVKLDKATFEKKDAEGKVEVDTGGKPVTEEADVVLFVAQHDVSDPYVLYPGVRTSRIIGTNKATALVQGIKAYLQSINFVAFDVPENTEARILSSLGTTTITTTVKPTTTTTTVKPTTTTTTVKPD